MLKQYYEKLLFVICQTENSFRIFARVTHQTNQRPTTISYLICQCVNLFNTLSYLCCKQYWSHNIQLDQVHHSIIAKEIYLTGT